MKTITLALVTIALMFSFTPSAHAGPHAGETTGTHSTPTPHPGREFRYWGYYHDNQYGFGCTVLKGHRDPRVFFETTSPYGPWSNWRVLGFPWETCEQVAADHPRWNLVIK